MSDQELHVPPGAELGRTIRMVRRLNAPPDRGYPAWAHPTPPFVFRWPWLADQKLITTVRVTIDPAGYGSRLELLDGPFPLDQPGAIDAWAGALAGGGGGRAGLWGQ